MTHATRPAQRPAALTAAAIAALLLAGCSTGHIGESWQCPLAAGGSCDSVAAADPAVPDPKAAGTTALAEPLWRVRGSETNTPPPGPAPEPAEPPCSADCDGGFDPFAWLARLFAADTHDGEKQPVGRPAPASAAPATQPSDPVSGDEADASAGPAVPLPARPEAGEEDAGATLPAAAERAGGDLRTGEVVARIWIAPFVDGNGVYREASHVRVVLEPAGWRLR